MEKYSKQREDVLEVLKKSYAHPTAEEVYLEMKMKNSTASKGTVYRNLNFLVEKGIIERISVQSGPDRFDYKKSKHNHAICVKCNKVYDFEYSFPIQKLHKTIKEQTEIEEFSNYVVVYGICKKCKNHEN